MTDRLHLEPKHRAILEALLREHLPGVEVWAYGSRVNGRSHDGSDLDLVLRGPRLEEIPIDRLVDFEEAVRESSIPFLVEARNWARVPERFHREIERERVVLEGKTAGNLTEYDTGCLGDVADIVMGQSPSSDTVSVHEGIPLLNGPTEFGPHHPVPVQCTTDPKKRSQNGDILFCVRGSTGRMNWADQQYAIGRGIAAIRHKHDLALQPLVRAAIESALPYLLMQATGSTFPNVSANQLAAIPYPEFDENEQRAIAHVLGTLDDKIELNRRMNATLEAMARALFKSWFVDFDPVRAKMEGRDTGLPQAIADLFPDRLVDSELRPIPEGWEVGVLDDVIELLSGGTPKTSVAEYWDGEIPWYTAKDTPPLSDVFVLGTERNITPAGVENSTAKILPARTIVITARGTVGKLACLGIPMAMNQTCYGIRGLSDYPALFTYFNIRMTADELQRRTHGTIFDTITRQTFKTVRTVLPPTGLAKQFESIVNSPMERILSNLHESRSLTALRDALLPKLVSGEIRLHADEQAMKAVV